MEILVVGNEINLQECKLKFGESHTYKLASDHIQLIGMLNENKIVFDFILDKPEQVSVYKKDNAYCVFLNSTNTRLTRLVEATDAYFFGFCGMPTFLNREILECTIPNEESKSVLEKICVELNTKFNIVDDRPGMITPRIICMIINEAYFAIEEDVASRSDIDLAMKLGTNYPFGPFEWSEKIGIKNVYQLLKAVSENTKEDRYKICSLLAKEALA